MCISTYEDAAAVVEHFCVGAKHKVDRIRLLYDKITDYIDLHELERLGQGAAAEGQGQGAAAAKPLLQAEPRVAGLRRGQAEEAGERRLQVGGVRLRRRERFHRDEEELPPREVAAMSRWGRRNA